MNQSYLEPQKGEMSHMDLLFFARKNGVTEQLQRMIQTLVVKDRLETYESFEELYKRLHQPKNDFQIAVLTATTDQELEDILTLQELLSDIRIVLILPDRTPNTISKAHKLAPRFLTCLDSDFGEVKAVLHKMLIRLHSNQIKEEMYHEKKF
jgi:hypothetical protein